MTITYRTAGAWGAGLGADLSALQIDNNFWDLHGRVEILEAWPTPAAIDDFIIDELTGQMTVLMDDYTTRGPYQLPVYKPQAFTWVSGQNVTPGMMFGQGQTIYVVIYPHLTVDPFDPGENDGMGNDYYEEFITVAGALPAGGAAGMALVKSTAADYDVTWSFAVFPPGGTIGQIVKKVSGTDYDVTWADNTFDSLSDVGLGTLVEDDVLRWDASEGMWKNESFSITVADTRVPVVTEFTGTGSVSIDATLGDVFWADVTGDITITLSSGAAVPGALITLEFYSTGPEVRTISFSGSGLYLAQATLVIANDWSATITLRSDGFGWTEVARTQDPQLHHQVRQNARSGPYTTQWSDIGGHIFHPSADTTARTWTIESNANVPCPIGSTITFVNQNGAGVITIAITTDTMRLAGAGTTGNRTLAANGIATALKVTQLEWLISGVGLT